MAGKRRDVMIWVSRVASEGGENVFRWKESMCCKGIKGIRESTAHGKTRKQRGAGHPMGSVQEDGSGGHSWGGWQMKLDPFKRLTINSLKGWPKGFVFVLKITQKGIQSKVRTWSDCFRESIPTAWERWIRGQGWMWGQGRRSTVAQSRTRRMSPQKGSLVQGVRAQGEWGKDSSINGRLAIHGGGVGG